MRSAGLPRHPPVAYLFFVRPMSRFHVVIFGCLLCLAERALPSESSPDEQTLWDLEHAYWHYVENNDLAAYSNLWHKDFLGWPSVSAAPVRKDHIPTGLPRRPLRGSGLTLATSNLPRFK